MKWRGGVVAWCVSVALGAMLVLGARAVEAAPAPSLTSIGPASGPLVGGTAITLTGTGFAAGATVDLGGAAAIGITVVNATTITATTPAHAPGAVIVTVRNTDGQAATLSGGFTFLGPPPTVTAVAPTSGSTNGGTSVTITGTEFGSGTSVVFGTAAATVTAVTSTSLTVTTSSSAAGTVGIIVTKADGQSATLAGAYTYVTASPPSVSAIAPTTGSHGGGTVVTITGADFATGASVRFGATPGTAPKVASATSMTVVAPAGTIGATVAVTVVNPDSQTGTLAGAYRYIDAVAPTVTKVSPAGGPLAGGSIVTITGTGFLDGATVKFGDTAGTVTAVSATSITAATPLRAAASKVSVTVTNPDTKSATLKDAYSYQKGPTATAAAPARGSTDGGTEVSLTGTNFLDGMTVTIGGVAATSVVLTGTTKVTFKTPPSTAGKATIGLANPDGQTGSLADGFTYAVPPSISAVTPASAGDAGGTVVTILGAGFATGAAVTLGGTAATEVAVVDAGRMTAKLPAQPAGVTAIIVTVDGLASPSAAFVVTSAGPTAGRITGTVSPAGLSAVAFGGGTSTDLVAAIRSAGCTTSGVTAFALEGGRFIGLIVGAPAMVNAEWEKRFTGGIPAGQMFIVRCFGS